MKAYSVTSIALILMSLLSVCCAPGQQSETLRVVLVDASCSRTNIESYQDGWSRVVSVTLPGDRLVLARISSDLRQFRPDLDVVRPRVSMLLDNPIREKKRDQQFTTDAREAFAKAIAVPCSQKTAILDSLDAVAQFFATDHRHPTLVVLSDMLECDDTVDFESDGISEREARQLLADRIRAHGLPHLSGVDVFVAGAAAPTSDIAQQTRRFWMNYFEATGTTLTREHFGPVLLGLQ